jgi:hypothetical protein
VGTQAPLGELNVKIALDRSSQRSFSISHSKWPFVVGFEVVLITTSSHSGGPFCNYNLRYTAFF